MVLGSFWMLCGWGLGGLAFDRRKVLKTQNLALVGLCLGLPGSWRSSSSASVALFVLSTRGALRPHHAWRSSSSASVAALDRGRRGWTEGDAEAIARFGTQGAAMRRQPVRRGRRGRGASLRGWGGRRLVPRPLRGCVTRAAQTQAAQTAAA